MSIGCTLTKNRPSVEWSYVSEADECHSLVLKQVNVDCVWGLNKNAIYVPNDTLYRTETNEQFCMCVFCVSALA